MMRMGDIAPKKSIALRKRMTARIVYYLTRLCNDCMMIDNIARRSDRIDQSCIFTRKSENRVKIHVSGQNRVNLHDS